MRIFFFSEFMDIKREQLRLERENKLLLSRILFELKEIRALRELSFIRAGSRKK